MVYVTCLHQECLQHKPIVLGGSTDGNTKDSGEVNVQAMKLVSISHYVCMRCFSLFWIEEFSLNLVTVFMNHPIYQSAANLQIHDQ